MKNKGVYMPNINDYIIHRNNHIYQIIDIQDNDYILTAYLDNQEITAKAKDIVRPILSPIQMEEVIERIPYIRTLEITSERYRQELYQKAMDKYDEIEWIKLIKTIYIRKKREQTKSFENEYFKAAQNIFHEEISVVLNKPINQVIDYIKDKIMEF